MRSTRRRPPNNGIIDKGRRISAGPRGTHHIQYRICHLLSHGHFAGQALRRFQFVHCEHGLCRIFIIASGGEEHLALCFKRGVRDIDLHQEAVKLCFGQGVGAFLLDRVLCGQNMKWLRELMMHTSNSHLMFLHRLQKRRLRPRACTVDFIGHHQLREYRALHKPKAALALLAIFQNFAAKNVAGHKIGCKLNALFVQSQNRANASCQFGFGEAGRTDDETMATCENRDQGQINHSLLAEDHGTQCGTRRLEFCAGFVHV